MRCCLNYLIPQTVDLTKPVLETAYFSAIYGDWNAHTWRVQVLNGGTPVDLTGATVTATIYRDDGVTVLLSGTVAGNIIEVVLTQECYAVVGTIRGSMVILRDEAKVTEAVCEGQVEKRAGNIIVYPGTPIPDISAVLAMVNDVNAATRAAQIAANMGAGLNLLYNSGFYANTDGWITSSGIVRDIAKRIFGANSMKIQASGYASDQYRGFYSAAANRIPCKAGDIFTISAWIFVEDYTLFEGRDMAIQIQCFNSAGTQVSNPGSSISVAPTIAHNGKWTYVTKTVTITAADAVSMGGYAFVIRNGTAWIACIKIERGSVATDWRPSWADILALPYIEDWKQPTLLNGWTEVSGVPVRYCKDAMGFVHFKGRVSNASTTSTGSILMSLPVGYRPGASTHQPIVRFDTGSNIARIYVGNDGTVNFQSDISAGTAVDISGLSFKAEA